MRTRRGMLPMIVGVAAALAVTTSPATADDTQLVHASVVVEEAEACLTVSTAEVDFGSAPFTSPTGQNAIVSSQSYTIDSCSTVDQVILARGQNAFAEGNDVIWTVFDPLGPGTTGPAQNVCEFGPDFYRTAAIVDGEPPSGTFLFQSDKSLNGADEADPFGPGASLSVHNELTMPCEGSQGGDAAFVSWFFRYTAMLLGS